MIFFFFWKLSWERTCTRGCFCWHRHVGGCYAENRNVFFWNLSGKGACDVLLVQTLERTRGVWKGYKYNPTSSGQCSVALVCLATHASLHLALLTLAFSDNAVALVHLIFFADHHLLWLCRERHTKELLVVFQQLLMASSVWLRPFGRASWFLVDWTMCCWFIAGVCKEIELLLLTCVN